MTKEQGWKALRKLLGKKAAYRYTPSAPQAELREEYAVKYRAARDEHQRIADEFERLKARLLDDPEYRSLLKAMKDARALREHNAGMANSYRLTVGLNEGWAFVIEAHGDNWAEVIRKVEAKRATP